MNKKNLAIIVCLIVLVFALTACNGTVFKQAAVSGAELDKPVENNGGLVVKQGKHIYFVNGNEGFEAENTFGTPYKTCIMRTELADDGSIVADSQKVIVPKNIYSSSTTSGIYIYDGWIYYATPNTEKTKTGEVNTTHLDFMRTTVDASRTELLHTLDSRSVNFRFDKGRLVYINGDEIISIDLTSKKTNNVKSRVSILDRVSSGKIIYSDSVFGEYIFAVRNLPTDISYKTYNELCVIKSDGSGLKTIITETTYTDNTSDFNNIFKINVLNYIVEDDGLTLYYTKSKTIGGTANVVGVFCYKFTDTEFKFDKANEKQLSYNTATTVTPIGYEEGILVTNSGNVTLAKFGENGKPAELTNAEKLIVNKAVAVKFINNGYVYYTASSSVNALYRYRLDGTENEQKVSDLVPLTTWVGMEVCNNYVYYIDNTSKYLNRCELKAGSKSELVGKMTAEDYKEFIEKTEK